MCGVIGCYSKSGFDLNTHHYNAVQKGLEYLKLRGPNASSIIKSKDDHLI